MAWCPKCRNEYIEGITHCSDCDVDLVDELVEERDVEYIYLDSVIELVHDMDDLIDYLHKASIDSAEFIYVEDTESDAIRVDKKQYSDAKLHLSVYIQNEAARMVSETSQVSDNDTYSAADTEDNPTNDDITKEIAAEQNTDTFSYADAEIIDSNDEDAQNALSLISPKQSDYTRLSDKYEDVKSSAYTLLLVGIIGAITILLEGMGIFTFPISPQTKWLFYTVMGGIFIAFIISGVFSLMHAQQLKIDADEENKTIKEILSWFSENHTKESIDAEIDTDIQEELLYFNRAEFIKNTIMHRFENVDEPLVDSLIESIYSEFFE